MKIDHSHLNLKFKTHSDIGKSLLHEIFIKERFPEKLVFGQSYFPQRNSTVINKEEHMYFESNILQHLPPSNSNSVMNIQHLTLFFDNDRPIDFNVSQYNLSTVKLYNAN